MLPCIICQSWTIAKTVTWLKMRWRQGEVFTEVGLKGWPRAAEYYRRPKYHFIRIDRSYSYATCQLLSFSWTTSQCESKGINVTGEASPPYWVCKCHVGDYNTLFKMNPPFTCGERSIGPHQGLKMARWLYRHRSCAYSPTEKDCEFDKAPFGIIGLENALAGLGGNTLPQQGIITERSHRLDDT